MTARAKRADIPYNPAIFRWARERARLNTEAAAELAKVKPSQISAWEDGEDSPTVVQARKLAGVYDRPFLEFFAETIPEVPRPLLAPDYRANHGASETEKAALEAIQGWAETQRLNAIDLYETLGEDAPRFPKAIQTSIDSDPEMAASRAREFLEFPVSVQLTMTSRDRLRFPTVLRKALEVAGVIVLKQSGLSKVRTRGICLYDQVLPVIVIGSEAPGGQAFTLAHEFAHCVIGESALSGTPRPGHATGPHWKRMEGWCNSFAAAFLMPSKAVREHLRAPRKWSERISDGDLLSLANSFAVSQHAMLIRLVDLGLVNPWYYWREKRKDFLREDAAFKAFGRPEYYGSRYRSQLGDHYTGLVLEAFSTGRIGAHNASEFMGIKNPRHLMEIQEHFGQ